MSDNKKQRRSERGFAAMDAKKQQEIASRGGQSVAPEDRSFSRNPELAAEAGRKGGEASHGGRGSGAGNFAQDGERASEPGRKGSESSRGARS